VYDESQVRQKEIAVTPHYKLDDIDCKGIDCNLLGFMYRFGDTVPFEKEKEGCNCKDHPVVCQSVSDSYVRPAIYAMTEMLISPNSVRDGTARLGQSPSFGRH
jgi:hypothetical protein